MPVPALADPEAGTLDDVVDFDRCPLHRVESPPWSDCVASVRRQLRRNGLATVPGFLRGAALADLAAELTRLRPLVTICSGHRNAYARSNLDSDLDMAGVAEAGLTSSWAAGHVTRDMFPPYSTAQRLYVAPGFKQFVAQCVGRERVFEYADPLAGLIATIVPPGGQYGWHYDTNEFVVTIAVEAAESGGDFEYVPGLRQPGNENLEGLRRVVAGDRSAVRSVVARPGDLQLFLGRYALHRVAPVTGRTDRRTLVLSYADRPGVIGPVERTRQIYGRVTEAHLVADRSVDASDGLFL